MKEHPRAEREEAKKRLPKPVYDFLVSPTLTNIYLGIQKKHGLDFRQLALFADIANVTLMGIETESALETNLHQAMHELTNQGARELVADLNDRVFKEAQRRLRENIREPSAWSETEPERPLSPEERAAEAEEAFIETAREDDPRFLAAVEKERHAEEERHKRSEAERAEALRQAANDPKPIDTEENEEEGAASTPESPLTILPSAGAAGDLADSASAAIPVASSAPARTIAEEKLGAPTQSAARAVSLPPENATLPQSPAPPTPHSPRAYKGNDPYREAAE